jgi:hypothetical protein
MTRPRILVGAILHETNTFNHVLTRLADFEGRYLCLDAASIRAELTGTATEMGGFMEAADARGWDAELAVAAACGPSGPLRRAGLADAQGDCSMRRALRWRAAGAAWRDGDRRRAPTPRARCWPICGRAWASRADRGHARHACQCQPPDGRRRRCLLPYETYPHVDHADCAAAAAAALERLLNQPPGPAGLPARRWCARRCWMPPITAAPTRRGR